MPAKKTPKKRVEAVDPVVAKKVEHDVAASIRKSQEEWRAMVEAARQPRVDRNAPPAYQGHDH
jgi:hypothetical protein